MLNKKYKNLLFNMEPFIIGIIVVGCLIGIYLISLVCYMFTRK